jgi:hypothetical protein
MKRRYRPWLWPLAKQIYGASKRPILVGPWRGEVGFEVLYWLPFLAELRERLGIERERIIPISRGGASVWYDAPQGLELFNMRDPRDVRIANRLQHQETGMLKQMHVTDFDRKVLQDAADTLGEGDPICLHPAWMYQTLDPFWLGDRGLQWLQRRMHFTGLPSLTLEGVPLPEKFVAVRFYFRATLRRTPLVLDFCKHAIKMIAKSNPVIVLNNPGFVDDHLDYLPKDEPNVQLLSNMVTLTPENNLAVQSAVLSRALGFVGTYGGMAQLALRLGKSSVSVYDEWNGTALPHKHLSEALAINQGLAFHVVKIGDLPLLQQVLPQVITG